MWRFCFKNVLRFFCLNNRCKILCGLILIRYYYNDWIFFFFFHFAIILSLLYIMVSSDDITAAIVKEGKTEWPINWIIMIKSVFYNDKHVIWLMMLSNTDLVISVISWIYGITLIKISLALYNLWKMRNKQKAWNRRQIDKLGSRQT